MANQQKPAPELSPQAAFGRNLRTIREARGMSQADCVEELAKHGITLHRQTLHKIETNARPLKLDEAVQISKALGEDVEFMMRGSDEFRLYELEGEIQKAYFAALEQVERMYELQISLARALDSGRYESSIDSVELNRSAKDLYGDFVSRLHRWKEMREDPPTGGIKEDLLNDLPNYFHFTVPNYSEQGEHMRLFLDAHPELKRDDGASDGEAPDASAS